MKAYIIYIATLLAALTQPAISQTSTDTKAAPDAPVMPYVITVKEPTSGETAKKLFVQSEYPTTSNIIYKDGEAENGGVAYNKKGVKFSIAPLPQGYFPEEGFPKVYETNAPNTAITIAFAQKAYTFTMPAKPVTIEVMYVKPDDLDLSTLTVDATLTYDKGRWTYKVGADGTPTPFSGTIKGKGTRSLEINATDPNATNTLLVKDGTELTGKITVNTNLELQVDKGGTATVRGDITSTKDFKTVTDSGRLYVYGQVIAGTGADISGMMQWTWETAPANNQAITIYTPLEETLTSFKADGTQQHFATNFPPNAAVKVKVGDKWQEGKDSGKKEVSTFKMDIFALTSFTDMKNSEQTPAKDIDGITITGDNTYKPGTDDSGVETNFDGTVTGEASTIKIDANATITLHQVKKKTADKPVAIEVSEDIETTIALKGNNELNTVTVGIGASLTLASIGEASLNEAPEITNKGTFTDETGIITKVKDIIEIPTAGNPEDKKGTVGTTITLTASALVSEDATKTTYTWQTRSKNTDPWTTYAPPTTQSAQIATKAEPVSVETSSITVPTDKVSTSLYRCQIKVEQTATDAIGEYSIVTTLSTKSCTVTVTPKSDGGTPDPDPTPPPVAPTHYTVTLPTLVGFTTNPAAGAHRVEEGYNFTFSLTLANGYIGSDPIVTTSRGETLSPRQSDGKYVISGVDRNITIYFTSIPTANEAIEAESLRIWNTAGGLNIHTPQAATTTIYTLSGHCIKQFDAPAGDSRIELPEGLYIVVAGNRQQKVIVR